VVKCHDRPILPTINRRTLILVHRGDYDEVVAIDVLNLKHKLALEDRLDSRHLDSLIHLVHFAADYSLGATDHEFEAAIPR